MKRPRYVRGLSDSDGQYQPGLRKKHNQDGIVIKEEMPSSEDESDSQRYENESDEERLPIENSKQNVTLVKKLSSLASYFWTRAPQDDQPKKRLGPDLLSKSANSNVATRVHAPMKRKKAQIRLLPDGLDAVPTSVIKRKKLIKSALHRNLIRKVGVRSEVVEPKRNKPTIFLGRMYRNNNVETTKFRQPYNNLRGPNRNPVQVSASSEYRGQSTGNKSIQINNNSSYCRLRFLPVYLQGRQPLAQENEIHDVARSNDLVSNYPGKVQQVDYTYPHVDPMRPHLPLCKFPHIRTPEEDHYFKTCSNCLRRMHEENFSDNQLRKSKSKRKCRACVAGILQIKNVEPRVKSESTKSVSEVHRSPEDVEDSFDEPVICIDEEPSEDFSYRRNQIWQTVLIEFEASLLRLPGSGNLKTCMCCQNSFSNYYFSKTQLKNPATHRTCRVCQITDERLHS